MKQRITSPPIFYERKLQTMQQKIIKLPSELIYSETHYMAWFRCPNCGVVFQHTMEKGCPGTQMKGACPYCGVKAGTAGVGAFQIVKFNPDFDEKQRFYYK